MCVQATLNSLELLTGQPAIASAPSASPVTRILLTERDRVLSQSCVSALTACPAGSCVCAVVGEGHVPGMQRFLSGMLQDGHQRAAIPAGSQTQDKPEHTRQLQQTGAGSCIATATRAWMRL